MTRTPPLNVKTPPSDQTGRGSNYNNGFADSTVGLYRNLVVGQVHSEDTRQWNFQGQIALNITTN